MKSYFPIEIRQLTINNDTDILFQYEKIHLAQTVDLDSAVSFLDEQSLSLGYVEYIGIIMNYLNEIGVLGELKSVLTDASFAIFHRQQNISSYKEILIRYLTCSLSDTSSLLGDMLWDVFFSSFKVIPKTIFPSLFTESIPVTLYLENYLQNDFILTRLGPDPSINPKGYHNMSCRFIEQFNRAVLSIKLAIPVLENIRLSSIGKSLRYLLSNIPSKVIIPPSQYSLTHGRLAGQLAEYYASQWVRNWVLTKYPQEINNNIVIIEGLQPVCNIGFKIKLEFDVCVLRKVNNSNNGWQLLDVFESKAASGEFQSIQIIRDGHKLIKCLQIINSSSSTLMKSKIGNEYNIIGMEDVIQVHYLLGHCIISDRNKLLNISELVNRRDWIRHYYYSIIKYYINNKYNNSNNNNNNEVDKIVIYDEELKLFKINVPICEEMYNIKLLLKQNIIDELKIFIS